MARGNEPVVLTPGGLDRLEAELTHLKTTRRAEVAAWFAEIQGSAGGDAEQEMERLAVREEMGLVEGRIAQLETVLANAVVVEPALREAGGAGAGARGPLGGQGGGENH